MNNQNILNQPRISLNETTGVTCEDCGNDIFVTGFIIRKVSRLVTGGAQDGIVPVNAFICSKCGAVLEDLLPEGIRENNKKSSIVS